MSIVFDDKIPPLRQRTDVDVREMDFYCLAPVYGAPRSVVHKRIDGQDYQLFRRSALISRRDAYAGSDLAVQREKMVTELCRELRQSRAYADYAIGMPDEFIYRESDGKIVKMPQSIYRQLMT